MAEASFIFEIGTKILILISFIAWPIVFWFLSIWTGAHAGAPKHYRAGFIISSLVVFKYFLYCFLILAVISVIMPILSKFMSVAK